MLNKNYANGVAARNVHKIIGYSIVHDILMSLGHICHQRTPLGFSYVARITVECKSEQVIGEGC